MGSPSPNPRRFLVVGGVRLLKALKDTWQEPRFDSNAIVGDRYLNMRVHSLEDYVNAAILGVNFPIRRAFPFRLYYPLPTSHEIVSVMQVVSQR
jgi:hypothetical protein